MLEIINRQPRYTEFVFPFWEARTEEMFEAGVWFHDTREYFGTIAAKAGLRKYVYDLLRGDAAGTIAEQYLTPDELHEQAQRVNDFLFELLHSAVQN